MDAWSQCLVRTVYTSWKALRSGPPHRQRQTVSLCEQLNVHACAADRLSISFHSRRSPLSWADMWWTSITARDGITMPYSIDYMVLYLLVHTLEVATMSAIPALSPGFTFPAISPAGTNPPDKSSRIEKQSHRRAVISANKSTSQTFCLCFSKPPFVISAW